MVIKMMFSVFRERVRMVNYQRIHKRRLKKIPQKSKHGFLLQGNSMFLQDHWEPDEQILISNLLPQMDLFINIGANIGYYCLMARNIGVNTIAFEPEPMNCVFFCNNMKNNNFNDGFILFPMAVGNNVGYADIYGVLSTVSLNKGFSEGFNIPRYVPQIQLDDALLGNRWVSGNILILIDVEGWEQHVLAGSKRMLMLDPKPIWIIEILPAKLYFREPNKEDILAPFHMMYNAGYSCYHIGSNLHYTNITPDNIVNHISNNTSHYNYIFTDQSQSNLQFI